MRRAIALTTALVFAAALPRTAAAQAVPIPTRAETFASPAGPEAVFDPVRTAGFTSPSPDVFEADPPWRTEVLPAGLLYRSYIANPKDARLSSRILQESGGDLLWALEAGARVGVLRYGTPSGWRNPATGRPEGFQLDIQGAAFPRLNFDHELDVDAVDFKVGVPLTYTEGPWEAKVGVYHLSSHVGDEFLLREPAFERLNYLRDAVVFGGGYYPDPDLRLYAEAEYAFNYDGGSRPWHVQFGFDWVPASVNPDLHRPTPFLAANARLREEVDWGGGVNVVAGVQWRGPVSDRLFRAGVQYYNGKSWQFSFFDDHEELLGLSIWYDF